MNITELVSTDNIALNVDVASKKKALEYASELLAQSRTDIVPAEIFDCLISRERLGSTGVGKGIAIPHCRLQGNQETLVAMLRLQQGIDFDSIDGKPVDILFAMVVPEDAGETHLKALAQLARMFSDESILTQLHEASDAAEICQILNQGVSAD
ncbi:MAG: PTS IIA-like nitrogen regulatory protein PtsN [Gammaproteobacteria bacterium]|nr:PTS IIA-like nitrogen regulatory protein PtsN [Gammaproteobacteria bacterium]